MYIIKCICNECIIRLMARTKVIYIYTILHYGALSWVIDSRYFEVELDLISIFCYLKFGFNLNLTFGFLRYLRYLQLYVTSSLIYLDLDLPPTSSGIGEF